ncbi:hypothetical protein GPLA_2587 [Paraglaciecola polaris LMG 21857]|uniref:Uncharacterized protein n=1 Tax=Paraglaciecola polaris LMG 21857 TaxID=1129793 RepID=K7ADT2_9ALTE|nr:hypothetical protein GPLA_2587 [Paraglaciecola polaris LMG 21857]
MERYFYAQGALYLARENFIFGVGAGNYENASLYYGFHQTKDPLNALISFLFIFLTSFVFLIKKSKYSSNIKYSHIVAFCAHCIKYSYSRNSFIYEIFLVYLRVDRGNKQVDKL